MTRELVGAAALYKKGKGRLLPLTQDHLLIAKQRLHLFSAVLLLERWGPSMSLMHRIFGWRELDYTGARAGSQENSRAGELASTPDVLRELTNKNAMDAELYEYAVALHESQLARYNIV
jgi:hypothetical protein